ncbi:MAG: chemotaxis protein CheW [Candidatus Eremiobacteraeota bacterium]|nr:chemotaxis protein CheW [Candidatus Eremiobacteraeota bacterium]
MIYDCWNRIGVHGDATCPELSAYVHCRNCPVYSSAARELLDVEVPADYLAFWTKHIAHERPALHSDTHSVVIFRVGVDWLALPTAVFKEIADGRAIHTIPQRRGGVVLGVASVRGQLIVCVSLRKVLDLEEDDRERPDRAASERLLVLAWGADRVVCPVSEVYGIYHYRARELAKSPASIAKAPGTYTKAVLRWENKAVALLDEELLAHSFERSLASTAT